MFKRKPKCDHDYEIMAHTQMNKWGYVTIDAEIYQEFLLKCSKCGGIRKERLNGRVVN